MIEQQTESAETKRTIEFELQQDYVGTLISRIIQFAQQKYWDYSIAVEEANAPSFAMAEQDRLRILDQLEDIRREFLAAFATEPIDGVGNKRATLFSTLDRIQYLVAQISALRSSFLRFSPAMNRSAIPQRSLFQSVQYRVDSILRGSVNRGRSSQAEKAARPNEILDMNAVYGRFTVEDDFPDIFSGVRELFAIDLDTEFALVSSGMTAEVVSNLLLQGYLGDKETLVCDTTGRYVEHFWAKRRRADGVFSLNTRPDTSFVFGDTSTLWPKIVHALRLEKKVIIRIDLIHNSQEFRQTDMLDLDMLKKFYSLSEDQRENLIFHLDTTLVPGLDVAALHQLVPRECTVITVSSMNKFHQSGYDIGGVGLVTDRTSKRWNQPLLSDLVSFGGFSPSTETLCTLDLLFSPELVRKRMAIIAANSLSLTQELLAHGVDARSPRVSEHLSDESMVGGLISIPKIGERRMKLLLEKLASSGIQVDYRTSFGHNNTSIEDVHSQEWSRISVGIEDQITIRTIGKMIAEVLSLDEAATEQTGKVV